MARKQDLRQQRAGTVINTVSKTQEKALYRAITRVTETLLEEFPGARLLREPEWKLAEVVDQLREDFPEVDFHYYLESSSMRPDGGIVSIVDHEGNAHPILISEKKNQGTNDAREKEGLRKQAKGERYRAAW